MKRSLKALLMTGVIGAALVGPVAPAHAGVCAGLIYDQNMGGVQEAVIWDCDSCPSPLALGDGRFQAVVCLDPR